MRQAGKEGQEPSAKRRKSLKSKKNEFSVPEVFSVEVMDEGVARKAVWFDDIVSTVFQPLSGLVSEEVNVSEVRELLISIVRFGFHGKAQLLGGEAEKETDKWWTMKKAVRNLIIGLHTPALMRLHQTASEDRCADRYCRSMQQSQCQ